MADRLVVYPDADAFTRQLFTGERLQRIENLGEFKIFDGTPSSPAEWLSRVEGAEAIILGWHFPDEVLAQLTNTKIIAFTGIGTATILNVPVATEKGITVTNAPGYADQTVAEHTIGLMLSLSRQISKLDRDIRQGGWDHDTMGFDINGKTLGLVGMGGIAVRTAQLANAFGMNVIAWTRNPSPERATKAGVTFTDLDTVISDSDIVSLHVELNDDTRGMISADRLATMQPHALLISTARGELVDEDAMIERLQSGKLSGAGLDVFVDEPLPQNHPLRSMDNVVLTPHTAYNTPEANANIHDIVIDTLTAYYDGTPINVVN